MRFLLLLAAFPALGAVGMVIAAVRARLHEPELRRTGEVAIATIVDSRRVTSDDGRVLAANRSAGHLLQEPDRRARGVFVPFRDRSGERGSA